MFKIILEKILPLYILIFSGYYFGKKKNYDLSYVSDIVFYLLAPILVFISFYKLKLNFSATNLILADIFYIVFSLFFFSLLFRKIFKDRKKYKAISLSLTFSNVAYLGLPLVYFLYGDQAFNIGIINFIVISFLHFSLGIYFLSGNIQELFKIPFLFSVLLAIFFKKLKINLSSSFQSFLDLTGKSSLPIMLITLGTRLSRVHVKEVKEGIILSVLKIIFNLIILIAVANIFHLSGLVKKVFILQNVLPSAILNYVFCEKYNYSPGIAASIIFFTTIFSLIYLPILIYFL